LIIKRNQQRAVLAQDNADADLKYKENLENYQKSLDDQLIALQKLNKAKE
jgi:hypothetical protein